MRAQRLGPGAVRRRYLGGIEVTTRAELLRELGAGLAYMAFLGSIIALLHIGG